MTLSSVSPATAEVRPPEESRLQVSRAPRYKVIADIPLGPSTGVILTLASPHPWLPCWRRSGRYFARWKSLLLQTTEDYRFTKHQLDFFRFLEFSSPYSRYFISISLSVFACWLYKTPKLFCPTNRLPNDDITQRAYSKLQVNTSFHARAPNLALVLIASFCPRILSRVVQPNAPFSCFTVDAFLNLIQRARNTECSPSLRCCGISPLLGPDGSISGRKLTFGSR